MSSSSDRKIVKENSEVENMSQYTVHSQKPKHVRRLDFGGIIPKLNTVDKSKGPDANMIRIDENVEGIPRTETKLIAPSCTKLYGYMIQPTVEHVPGATQYIIIDPAERLNRKRSNSSTEMTQINDDHHIDIYKNMSLNNSRHNSASNVIVNKSPVLVRDAYYHKRRHERFFAKNVQEDNDNEIIETDNYSNRNMNSQFLNTEQYVNRCSEIFMSAGRQREIDSNKENQDEEIYVSKNIIVPTSSNSAVIEDNIIIKNRSIDKYMLNNLWQDFTSRRLECSMPAAKQRKIDYFKDESDKVIYVPKNMVNPTFSNSSVIEDNIIINNNTVEENTSDIESISSDDSDTIDQTEITDFKSDDDEILNILIEDTEDSKDMISLANNSIAGFNTVPKTSCEVIDKDSVASTKDSDGIYYKKESNKSTFPYKIKTRWTKQFLQDFDETFYSNAESIKSESFVFENDHALEEISQVTTCSNESADNQSSQTNCFISTATSPEKTSNCPAMSLQILDSCNKRRRIKKKSLTAKLQSLVNRQTSFVRIWLHQIKQADIDGTLSPHVDVYVDKCTTHLNRQFLEGIVLSDPFNLLNNNENQENSNLSESSYKMITMIIVPDIVGKIEMKLESIVKIYPPWDIIDKSKSVLNITYIKMVSNEQRRAILNQINISERKKEKVLIEESNCLCLEAKKIISSCKERSNDKRIDVMTEIYNF